VNKKARTAATSLGLTILLTVFRDLRIDGPGDASGRAHRFGCAELFFDTLLFCGAMLLLANSIDKMKNKVGTLLIANRQIAGLIPSDVTPRRKG
jgi:hypothetical protein